MQNHPHYSACMGHSRLFQCVPMRVMCTVSTPRHAENGPLHALKLAALAPMFLIFVISYPFSQTSEAVTAACPFSQTALLFQWEIAGSGCTDAALSQIPRRVSKSLLLLPLALPLLLPTGPGHATDYLLFAAQFPPPTTHCPQPRTGHR